MKQLNNTVVSGDTNHGGTITRNNHHHISLVPNPANDKVIIYYSSTIKQLTISNMYGVIVKQISLSENNNNITINVSDLSSGLYIYTWMENNITHSSKLIINR
jgi:hypothetical protein